MSHIIKAGIYRQTQLGLLTVIFIAATGGLMSCGKNPVDDKPHRDTTQPTVVATVPLDHDSIVPANTVISATFSEAMDPATMAAGTLVLPPSFRICKLFRIDADVHSISSSRYRHDLSSDHNYCCA